jgi:hypothetical protein
VKICLNCGHNYSQHYGFKCDLNPYKTLYEGAYWNPAKAKGDCNKCAGTGITVIGGNFCDCLIQEKCKICKNKGYTVDSFGDKSICKNYKCDYGEIWEEKEFIKKKKIKEEVKKKVELSEEEEKLYALYAPEQQIKLKPGNNEIVYAKFNQLQLDYDQETIPEQFHKMLPVLRERFGKGEIKWESYHSSSGKHLHVIVELPADIMEPERILWQSVFGSDCMREGLSILRMAAKINKPSLLFMPVDRVVLESGIVPEKPARKFKEL